MQEVYTEDDILFIKIPVKLATKKTDKISIYNTPVVLKSF